MERKGSDSEAFQHPIAHGPPLRPGSPCIVSECNFARDAPTRLAVFSQRSRAFGVRVSS